MKQNPQRSMQLIAMYLLPVTKRQKPYGVPSHPPAWLGVAFQTSFDFWKASVNNSFIIKLEVQCDVCNIMVHAGRPSVASPKCGSIRRVFYPIWQLIERSTYDGSVWPCSTNEIEYTVQREFLCTVKQGFEKPLGNGLRALESHMQHQSTTNGSAEELDKSKLANEGMRYISKCPEK
ncbi:hypothetical protein BDN70DRAFT_901331 [Pholiota conissans]|uniref:Uncharacterized protein n=1 Tax=Pholiota conissans TaxID=109636 RepID=A0A9P5YMB9_9AGAR|nr:hypothetical protein BDN70DRAFT_901331 [Pholiota conissans]